MRFIQSKSKLLAEGWHASIFSYIRLRSFTFRTLWKQSCHRNPPEHPVQLPRHPTFFFFNFFIWICMHDTEKFLFSSFPRTLSRLKQRSAVFTNLLRPYLPSTWHLEGAVWRNKKETRRPLNYKTSFARSRTPVGRRAASERVRAHCSCGKPLAQKDNKTRQKRRAWKLQVKKSFVSTFPAIHTWCLCRVSMCC